ncbi:MAG: polysaccharide deacetylase [Phenylobacterium sp.]|nr:polysaccharide deacetylase [Phenylobacterium sp.]
MRNGGSWQLILGLGLALAAAAAGAQGAREPAPPPRPQFVAFYVPWEPPALASLKAHVQDIDVFAPMWGSLVSAKGEVRWEADPEAHAVLAAAARRPQVMPILSNAHDEIWDKAAAEAVILQPAAAQAFARALVRQAQADGYDGFVVDFENLTPRATAAYPAFLAHLRDRLKAAGRELWVTAAISSEDGLPPDLARDVDAVVLMAYDQCWAASTPGPIAADAWLKANLTARIGQADPRRYIVALASYGYDWPQGRTAEVVSAAQAAQRAAKTGQAVEHPPGSNAHFSYRAAGGTRHEVWWADASDVARQRAMVEPVGVRGVALWRMGLEDPGLWTARASAPAVAAGPATSCEPLPGH